MSATRVADGLETTPFRLSRVGRQALVYGAGILLSKAAAFVMLPVYTRYLTTTDYGVLDLINVTLIEATTVFAGASLVIGIFRFYHKAEGPDERQALLSTALLLLSASYAILAGCIFVMAPQLSTLLFGSSGKTTLLRIASGSLAWEGFILVPLAYLRIRERSQLFVIAQSAKLALQLGLNLVFLIPFGMGAQGVLLSGLLANSVLAPVLLGYLLREIAFRPSRQAARQLLRFGVPLITTQMAMFIVTYADRYFLQAAAGSAVVGLYALSYQFGFLLFTLADVPFSQVWDPLRFEVAKRPDRDRIYARYFVYLSVVFMTLGTLLALFVRDFLRVMAAPAFLHAADIVPLLLAAYMFHGWAKFHSIGILVRERTWFIACADWSAAIVALVCYWLWIPPLLGFGAALATLAAFAVRWAIVYGVSQWLWPVRYEWRGVVQLAGVAGVVVAVGLLLPGETLVESVGARLVMFAVLGVALWCLPLLSDEERALLRRARSEPRVVLGKLIG